MSRIFISHSSKNNDEAVALSDWLKYNGWGDTFLDIMPDVGLAAGQRWSHKLATEIERCEAGLFIISRDWCKSLECIVEFTVANRSGKCIFGVRIDATPLRQLPKHLVLEWHLCDLFRGRKRTDIQIRASKDRKRIVSFSASGLEQLKRGLQESSVNAETFQWPPQHQLDREPYRGLHAFEAQDAAVFFGRETEIVHGLKLLRDMHQNAMARMLVIFGASGAGKSSFLRAGLWPRLKRDDRHFITLPVIRPEKAVINGSNGLLKSLEKAFHEHKVGISRAKIRAQLHSEGGLRDLLMKLQKAARSRLPLRRGPPLIVISIDQGEEIYDSDGSVQEVEQLCTLLTKAVMFVEDDHKNEPYYEPPALLVVAIRSMAYEHFQNDSRITGIRGRKFLELLPLMTGQFKAIIEGPARLASLAKRKLRIEPALTDRLLKDTEGADALPLLSFTLSRLYEEHGSDGELLLSQYQNTLGGVQGVIDAAVKVAFDEPDVTPRIPLDESERELLMRQAFIPWLVAVDGETGKAKRRIARWEQIPIQSRTILERLVRARLLIRDRRSYSEDETRIEVVEVAHEALLRRWGALLQWIDGASNGLKTADLVKRAATEWHMHGKHSDWLIHAGGRLNMTEKDLSTVHWGDFLGEDVNSYLHACRAKTKTVSLKELERLVLESESTLVRERMPQRGLLLVTEALKRSTLLDSVSPRTHQAVRFILDRISSEPVVCHKGEITRIAISHDGHNVISVSRDGLIVLSQRTIEKTWTSRVVFRVENQTITALSLSGDGSLLTFGTSEGRVLQFDLRTVHSRAIAVTVLEHSSAITVLALSNDGAVLAAGFADGAIWLYDKDSVRPEQATFIEKLPAAISALGFSTDRRWFAAGMEHYSSPPGEVSDQVKGNLRLWNLEKRDSQPIELCGDPGGINGLQISDDGQYLIAAHYGGDIQRWELDTADAAAPVASFNVDPYGLSGFASSCDGKSLIVKAKGKFLRSIDLDSEGNTVGRRLRPTDEVLVQDISVDGRWIAGGGPDGLLWLWDREHHDPEGKGRVLHGHDGDISCVRFSANGKYLITGSTDSTVLAWNLAATHRCNGADLEIHLSAPNNSIVRIFDLHISKCLRWLFTRGTDGTVLRINLLNLDRVAEVLEIHCTSIKLSDDGRRLYGANEDGTVWRREVHSEQLESPIVLETDLSGVWEIALKSNGCVSLLSLYGDNNTICCSRIISDRIRAEIKTTATSWGSTVSGNGRWLVSVSEGRTVHLWDFEAVNVDDAERVLMNLESSVAGLAINQDGSGLVILCQDGTLLKWDLQTSTRSPKTISSNMTFDYINLMQVSRDAKWLVIISDGVWLWCLENTAEIAPAGLDFPREQPIGMTISNDATWLAVWGEKGSLYIWNLRILKENCNGVLLPGHTDQVTKASFSHDNRWLFTASADGIVRRWQLTRSGLLSQLSSVASRNFSMGEWNTYFDEPYRKTFDDLSVIG